MSVVIVFGVSGVGKTTLCRELISRRSDLRLLTASALIAEALGVPVSNLRTAPREQILGNQNVLTEVFQKRLANVPATTVVLLDGQCVVDNGQDLVTIPAECVTPFEPKGLLLLEVPAGELLRRRLSDTKQRPARNVSELDTQIQLNRRTVASYGKHLNVPHLTVEARDADSLEAGITELLSAPRQSL